MSDAISSPRISSLGTILSIWAHPDDETYLAGGVMAAARDAGLRVVCVTATAGERGTPDPAVWPPERLGAVRLWEARAAMAVLGVEEHHCLGLPDGGLDALDEEGIARIGQLIDDVQPDTILTFGPDGATFHPDHIAVHRWVTAAWHSRGEVPTLLCSTQTADYMRRFRRLHEEWGVFMADLRPVGLPRQDLAVLLELDERRLDQKLTALRAMATQVEGTFDGPDRDETIASLAEEAFFEARPAASGHGPQRLLAAS